MTLAADWMGACVVTMPPTNPPAAVLFGSSDRHGPQAQWPDGSADGNPLPLAGRRVLIVEDEALIAMELEFTLQDAGATIIGPVPHLNDAIAIAKQEAIDIAVLDVDLGGRDVFPAADILQGRGVPFVFHTGHAERAELTERYGDAPVCRKPASAASIVKVLRRAISD